MIPEILTGRRRDNQQPRAIECDPNGSVYTTPAGGMAGAVTIADGADVAQGATTDAEAAAGNGTVIAILKRLRTLLSGTITVGGVVDVSPAAAVLRAAIDCNALGDNTIVAAGGTGLRVKVLAVILVASGDVDVRFESGAGGAALTGVMSLAADGNGFVLPMGRQGYHWFETAANTLLNLELSVAVQVGGCIVYYLQP